MSIFDLVVQAMQAPPPTYSVANRAFVERLMRVHRGRTIHRNGKHTRTLRKMAARVGVRL